jgi:hypothetical protein
MRSPLRASILPSYPTLHLAVCSGPPRFFGSCRYPSWRGALRDEAIQLLVPRQSWIASPKWARKDEGAGFMHQDAKAQQNPRRN